MKTYRYRLPRGRRLSPRTLKTLFILLGAIILIDLLTTHFASQVQLALTPPIVMKNNSASGGQSVQVPRMNNPATALASPVATRPAKTTASTPAATTPPAPVTNFLARDSFQRANQQFWGSASDGQPWMGDAMNVPVFSIANHTGLASNGSGIFDALLGPRVSDSETLVSASVSTFQVANIGALLRWNDADNMYKAFIDGNSFTLLKKVGGVVSVLQSIPFAARGAVAYTMRVRVTGTRIQARVWQTGQAEPATWMLAVTDSSLTTGFDGVRVVLQNGITITVSAFSATKV